MFETCDALETGDVVRRLKTAVRGILWSAALMCVAGSWESASARQHRSDAQQRDSKQQRTARGPRPSRERGDRQGPPRFKNGQRPRRGDRFGSRGRFGPSAEDRRPLEAGEAEQLMQFAGEHFPDMYNLLLRVEERDAETFDKQLRSFAPKLRFLMRLQRENPKLAEILIALAESEHKLRQYRRGWRGADPRTRRRIEQAARDWIDKKLELEERIMRLRIEKLTDSREARIEERFADLTAEDAEIATEPAELRELADVFRAAPEDQRAQIEAQIRVELAAGIDDELGAIRQRLQQRERNRGEEVDRRTRRLFSRSYKSRPKSKRP